MKELQRLGNPRNPVTGLVVFSCRHPFWVTLAAAALCAIAVVYAGGHFKMTTDTAALISPKVTWRVNEAAMDATFPQNTGITLVVVTGATGELAEQGAQRLTAALEQQKSLFLRVRRPDGGPFFAKEGLLFRSQKEVKATTDQLLAAQPFLGPLAADPSIRGVMGGLSTLARGVKEGRTSLATIDPTLKALAGAVDQINSGQSSFFSWQALIASGDAGLKAPLRRFIQVKSKLNYSALMPGADASTAIRQTAAKLGLDPAHGVTVRLTGSVPLSDEEFSSLSDKAWLVVGAMVSSMLAMLWLAVKSVKIMVAILVTTIAGLILTAALGLVTVGRFNLISVAFIPLFVGLGVDFGIQLSVRFKAELLNQPLITPALVAAAKGVGGALALAAVAITLGFFAFIPTQYVGVSELGVIAGVGMVIALILALSLLPALLILLRIPPQTADVGNPRLAPLDRLLLERRKVVLWIFAISMAVSVALLPLVQFDFNPLHLKNPRGEAMATLTELMRDPDNSPNTIDVLEPSLAAAEVAAKAIAALPQVSQALTLSSFVPQDQGPKLAIIKDADALLDTTLNPFDTLPPPSDAEIQQSLRQASTDLSSVATAGQGPGALDAKRLASGLATLAAGPPAVRVKAADTLITPLNVLLAEVRDLLLAEPVQPSTLPADLQSDWVGTGGRARIEVFPKGASNDNATLVRFSKAVRALAPNASGGPISIQEAGKTISGAFIEAGLLSLVVITILLLFVLRSVREVAFTLAPIILSGFLTLGSCVLIGQPINFANIIAFPLLFGVGVAFHIYFVMAWRDGAHDLLQSSLARAVFFSALTTGAAFASLMLSSHPGTASMGKILMIALFWTLVCALLFEPALLGPPKAQTPAP